MFLSFRLIDVASELFVFEKKNSMKIRPCWTIASNLLLVSTKFAIFSSIQGHESLSTLHIDLGWNIRLVDMCWRMYFRHSKYTDWNYTKTSTTHLTMVHILMEIIPFHSRTKPNFNLSLPKIHRIFVHCVYVNIFFPWYSCIILQINTFTPSFSIFRS